jgi:hypothetical protein
MSQDCSVNAPLSSALATNPACGLPQSRIAASWYDDRAPVDSSGWPGVGVGVSGDDLVPFERDAGRRQRQNKPRESVTARVGVKMFYR